MADESGGRVEDILAELGKKIDQLIEDAKEVKDDVRDEVEKKISELKTKKEKLEDDFKDYKQQEKWQDAKEHFHSALMELKRAAEAVFAKKS